MYLTSDKENTGQKIINHLHINLKIDIEKNGFRKIQCSCRSNLQRAGD